MIDPSTPDRQRLPPTTYCTVLQHTHMAPKGGDGRPARLDRAKSHVRLTAEKRGESIQQQIIRALRKRGERLRDLFKKMDDDGSNTIERAEFCDALKRLHIVGGVEDYYSLFDAWDSDGSGNISLTELLAAVSGRRYDAFEAFDADLGNRSAQIAANALKAYHQACDQEAAIARKNMGQALDSQRDWLRARWHAAGAAVSVALWLQRKAREEGEDSSEEDDMELVPSPRARGGGGGAASSGQVPIDATVEEAAATEAEQLCELALKLHLSDSGAEQLKAENELLFRGVCYEVMKLEPSELLPLLSEMGFARVVGMSAEAQRRLPEPAFFGPQEVPLPAGSSAQRRLSNLQHQLALTQWAQDAASGPDDLLQHWTASISNRHRQLQGFGPPAKLAISAAAAATRAATKAAAAAVAATAAAGAAAGPTSSPFTPTLTFDIAAGGSSADASAAVALVLVARLSQNDDTSWLGQLPRGATYHVIQSCGVLQPELPASHQTLPKGERAGVGGAGFAYLCYMSDACRALDRYRARRGQMKNRHVQLDKSEQKTSIQQKIHDQMRAKGARVQDIFRKWDCDQSNSVSKTEFRRALAELRILGSTADYDSLFDAWDVDGSGTLTYTELLAALSGQRYDAFASAPPPPPFPPLLICTPGNPFDANPRFLEDVRLLVTLAEKAAAEAVAEAPAAVAAADDVKAAQAGGRVGGRAGRKAGGLAEGLPPVVSAGDPHAYAQVAAARALPPFIPLGLSRGDAPTDTTRPSWSRPEVFCDPSGGPQEATLLPVGALWRRLFGPANPVPLWIGYTPGSVFAVSRTACLAKRPRSEPSRAPSKLYERAAHAFGLNQRREPVAELALERLWRHIFIPSHAR